MSAAQKDACDFFVYIPQHTGALCFGVISIASRCDSFFERGGGGLNRWVTQCTMAFPLPL